MRLWNTQPFHWRRKFALASDTTIDCYSTSKNVDNALGLFSKTKLQSTYEIMISVLSCQICEVGGLVVIHKRT